MPNVHVITPGILTTIQDEGRWGYQSNGVSVAGPMDPCAHRIVNALVGNARSAASLEITLVGPELKFEDERVVAVGGADFDVTLDNHPMPRNAACVAPAGASLRFGARRRGARAYLGIEGGIAVPPILGSRATHVISTMGGIDGRALEAGDRLPLGERRRAGRLTRTGVPGAVEGSDQPTRLRILPGPNRESFTAHALEALQSGPYVVEAASNRMGFRLQGPPLAHSGGADIISDATPLGALQVPASGQPILLMADRPTTGGYPKIATVITADISAAGQLAPGDALVFVICGAFEALAALIAQERSLMAIEARTAS